MNRWEAMRVLERMERKTVFTEEEEFELIETLRYMIEETKDCRYAEWLGGIYYDKRMFDLALKYYELAESLGSQWAWNGLGYIWYYGRTGTVDYQKSFEYFSKAAEKSENAYNRLEAGFKLADMYRNGYYVEKDLIRYRAIIENLYEECRHNWRLPKAEVYTRLAPLRAEVGKKEEAADLYLEAREELIGRVMRDRFFGDLNRIKWATNDLYKLIPFDPEQFDLFDLYYLLKKEHLVRFTYDGIPYEIESRQNEGDMNIRFEDKWYRNIDDFFQKAELDGQSIEERYFDEEDWRILR